MRENVELDRRIVALRAAKRLADQLEICLKAISMESRGLAEQKSINRAMHHLGFATIELNELEKLK